METNNEKGIFSSLSDLSLAVAVVLIIALMVLPLPALVLDVLVALNIIAGLVLVLMGVYITTPLQFSVFPSVLLITTLYRLALSVATTRMILLHGNAGDIINTFGNMVAGGNIVVGLVVFLIITLVQFIVIAKGAERVAEVAARFTLDAMPGKQLSIDSDLRSGLIDKEEAKRKRREIELESKLHGSMDGAMKFVKGDAIAGIVIIIINLIGGLAIGILQLDMEAADAMAKYSILTVGDGMVAQIPALLGAMAAGLIVTRATDENEDKHLGDSIHKQLTSIPKVIFVTGILCLFLSLVPGFPSIVFVVMAVTALTTGALLLPLFKRKVLHATQPKFENIIKAKEQSHHSKDLNVANEFYHVTPLRLLIKGEKYSAIVHDKLSGKLIQLLNGYQKSMGFTLPKMVLDWEMSPENKWLLYIHDVPVAEENINNSQNVIDIPITVFMELRKNVKNFVGLQETSTLMAYSSNQYPDLVKEVLRVVPMQSLSIVFKNLVSEEIPISNIKQILESLIEVGQQEKDPNNLTEYARISLRRQITYKYSENGELSVLIIHPSVEEKLIQSIRMSGGNVTLNLHPNTVENLKSTIISEIDTRSARIVLTAVQLRRHIRQLIESAKFEVPVLSHAEIDQNTRVSILGTIGTEEQTLLAS